MQNISDDELDKVFREAAGKQSFDFDPSAWESMRTRLDQGSGTQESFLTSRLMSTLLAVGILALLWYQTQRGDGSSVASTAAVGTPGQQLSTTPTESDNQKSSLEEEKAGDARALPTDGASHRQDPILAVSGKNTTTVAIKQRAGRTGQPVGNEIPASQEPTQGNTDQESTVRNESPHDIHVADTKVSEAKNTQGETLVADEKSGEQSRRMLAVLTSEASSDSVRKESSPRSDSVMVTVRDSTLEKQEQDSFKRAWFVRASIAPDLTTVGIDKPTKIGSNFGLTLEYQFARHWSVSTGAILSRKIYEGTDVEYAFGASTVTADKMDGNCRVLDIPLNVYYYGNTGRRISFFAGVGVTSYLMLTEDYAYTVTNGYGTNVYKQNVSGENQDWFKQLNLSVGIQSRLSRRLWWQVEPFFKAPLAGVGEGKVSLATSGAFLSVRYQITKD
jgi:hypothetical protein